MDGHRNYHTKWSNSDKDKYHTLSLRCELKKNGTNELIYETETDSDFKTNLYLPNGNGKH